MPKTQLHNKKKQTLSPRRILAATVALIVAGIMLMSTLHVVQKYIAARKRIRDLSDEQKTLSSKQSTLASMNAYLATPEGTEETLREKYNVVKPGEGVIVITDTDTTTSEQPRSRVARWWRDIMEGLGLHKK